MKNQVIFFFLPENCGFIAEYGNEKFSLKSFFAVKVYWKNFYFVVYYGHNVIILTKYPAGRKGW